MDAATAFLVSSAADTDIATAFLDLVVAVERDVDFAGRAARRCGCTKPVLLSPRRRRTPEDGGLQRVLQCDAPSTALRWV